MTVSVLLLGGECTGKTSLATAVAEDQRARGRSVLVVSEALRDFVLDSLTRRREVAGVRTEVVFEHERKHVIPEAAARAGPLAPRR